VSLRVSADERCLFCTSSAPGSEPVVGDEFRRLTPAQGLTLWSTCLECGFTVPTTHRTPDERFGQLEEAEHRLEGGKAVLIIPSEAVLYFYPSTPEQIVNASIEAGFQQVHFEVLGDELVAGEYLRLWEETIDEATWIRSTSPIVVAYVRLRHPVLLPYLTPVVTPAVALARYLEARQDVDLVHAGLEAPGGTARDREMMPSVTLEGLAELFHRRGIDPETQPLTYRRIPAERRRYLSVPGGLPRDLLDSQRLSTRHFHKIRDLKKLAAVASLMEGGEAHLGFLDVLPFDGALDHPALGPAEEYQWRRQIAQLVELPRASEPVVDRYVDVDLSIVHEDTPSALPTVQIDDILNLVEDSLRSEEPAVDQGRSQLVTCPFRMGERYRKALRDARHDALTGLYSYGAFRDRLKEEFARASRYGVGLGLLLVDLDGFKEVNDSYGHAAGNEVLRAVAGAVEACLRQSDFAARFGGDEIVVLVADTDSHGLEEVARKIQEAISELRIGHRDDLIRVTASLGLAHHDGASGSFAGSDQLFAEADASLYIAKAQGGAAVHPHHTEELTQHEP